MFRFEQERGFKGADRAAAAARDGPVQFQREEDPFGLTDFLKDVRQGGSAPVANSSSKRNTDDREERGSEKRRKK